MTDTINVSELLTDIEIISTKITSLEPNIENVMIATKLMSAYIKITNLINHTIKRMVCAPYVGERIVDPISEFKTRQQSLNNDIDTVRYRIKETRESIINSDIIKYLQTSGYNVVM